MSPVVEQMIAEFIEAYGVGDAGVWAESPIEAAAELVQRLAVHGYVIRLARREDQR